MQCKKRQLSGESRFYLCEELPADISSPWRRSGMGAQCHSGLRPRRPVLGLGYTTDTIHDQSQALTHHEYIHLHYSIIQSIALLSCLVSILVIVIYQITHGRQHIGLFAIVIYYFQNIFGHLGSLSFPDSKQYYWLADAKALYILFNTQSKSSDGLHPFRFVLGGIAFQNVGFSYDGRRRILHDVTFQVEPGQQVALVGDPGCGKTTILKLLWRVHDVECGRVMIDGQDLRNLTQDSFRRCIGVVPQDVPIFDGSIMENVRQEIPQAMDNEVIEACKSAAFHEQILTKAEGYNAQVGRYGDNLSGAEKKKIGLARVFLKNPRIVLLDDTVGSFDTETDLSIQKATQRLTTGRTTIVTTCR